MEIFKILCIITLAIQFPAGCTGSPKNISSTIFGSKAPISIEQPIGHTGKKWQVGRVSRKHYEIVNMLWRKTKIFVDPETTTSVANRHQRNHAATNVISKYKINKPLSSTRPHFQSSTPSFIEFYYLDDNDDRIKRRDSLVPMPVSTKPQRNFPRDNFIRSPVLSLRVDDQVQVSPKKCTPIDRKIPKPSPQVQKRPIHRHKPSIYGFLSKKLQIDLIPIVQSNTYMFKHYVTTEKYFDNETCPATFEPQTSADSTKHYTAPDIHKKDETTQDEIFPTTYEGIITSYEIESTTNYDKIKFFEMYDQYTVIPDINNRLNYEYENKVSENEIDGNQKVNLQDLDRSIGHHDGTKAKNVKKHIDESLNYKIINNNKIEKKFMTVMFNSNKTDVKIKSDEIVTTYKALKKLQNDTWAYLKNSSRIVKLSDYPFAAVYVYEPSQIQCDAAALSPHWLIAAGSCLSRFHRKDRLTDDLQGSSAFVTYCSQNWWQPERISYVKYIMVHPRFHPKDDSRRFSYNIGLIQVVGSMSSCVGWAPITLMSHNFAASDGSIATAVGWGLDRYDVRYTSADLPKQPLSAYSGFVFANSCPGSKFGKMKLSNQPSTTEMSNLYCLSLPPYSGEENDPIHGSLLLVGGKLIALYLQEERRAWGQQSAQYTGVWRLVPWVHEVAREPDEADALAIDI